MVLLVVHLQKLVKGCVVNDAIVLKLLALVLGLGSVSVVLWVSLH